MKKQIQLAVVIIIILPLLSLTIITLELETKNVLNNKVQIKIPKGFKELSEQEKKEKFLARRAPTIVFSNSEGDVNITLDHTTSSCNQDRVAYFQENYTQMFKMMSATVSKSAIKKIHGKRVGIIQMEMPDKRGTQSTSMIFTDFEGYLLVCTFYYPKNKDSEWLEISEEIINSLKIK